ncbi:hypothetical protein AALB39_25920 [Lachnospiraceae bacterium 54-53]
MFSSFNEDEFRKAIKEKNYLRVKVYIISAIRNNPDFGVHACKSEVYNAIEILDKELPEIFADYTVLEGETPFSESESALWDKKYFIWQTTLLEENFSKERLKNIGKIGEKISNFQKPQGQTQNHAKSNPLNQYRAIAGIALLILLFLVVILSIRQK